VSLKFDWLVVDCRNPMEVARFWEQALPVYEIHVDPESEDEDEVLLVPADRRGPKILFGKGDDEKLGKNRLHFDLTPEASRDEEVARLEALGAKRIDIGQGDDVTWVVMADVEGNEFCVLNALTEEQKTKPWAW
jgi:hypothetical protein